METCETIILVNFCKQPNNSSINEMHTNCPSTTQASCLGNWCASMVYIPNGILREIDEQLMCHFIIAVSWEIGG